MPKSFIRYLLKLDGSDSLQQARQSVPSLTGCDDWQILHRLNEFLATEPPGDFVITGSLFAAQPEPPPEGDVWVCMTPACDLVPREPRSGTWEHTLHPLRHILAMRGVLKKGGASVLKEAEHGQYVYLMIAGKPYAVSVIDQSIPNPKLEHFLLDDMGRIKEGSISAYRLEKSSAGIPTITQSAFTVIGQLRQLYANRLLQRCGQHLSRIGVDFVNLPESPKKTT